jgi:hypothetical protein
MAANLSAHIGAGINGLPPNGLAFSCRDAPGEVSKSHDLAREGVSWNGGFGGSFAGA